MTPEEKKQKLQTVLANELARAEGADSDELQANRTKALRYYQARPRGDEKEGRSQSTSTDVRDMINADLAIIVPMISTDCVVDFEPNSEEDEVASKAESYAVNQVIIEDNHGFIQIQTAVKDSLLMKNGCMKISVEDDSDVQSITLPSGLPPEQIAALLEPRAPNETRSRSGDKLTIVRDTRRFVVRAVPIENISYAAGFTGPLQKIRFFAEQIDYTRSELVELGIDRAVVDALPPWGDWDNSVARLRDVSHEDSHDAETSDQDSIECHEAYILIDLDGDGISERYRCLIANRQTLLDHEPADLLPYALGSPFLNPHRITGESLADHLFETQDVKTTLLRQYLDNVGVINNGRYAYDPSQTHEEDVLNPRAGGGIRARNPAQAVVPLPVIDVTTGIQLALDYQDKMRTERGGAALEMMSSDRQLAGETAWGIERQMAMREAMVSMLAKNLSETLIRDIYTLTHEYMRRYSLEPVMVRIQGQYAPMDPRQWMKRTRCNVTVGMSPGQRGHVQNVLAQSVQLAFTAMQAGAGGVLVDPTTIYRTVTTWQRMAGVDNPERLWIDPASPKAQQAQQGMQKQAQAQQAEQKKVLQATLLTQQEKIASDERQHSGDLKFKYHELSVKTETEEAKMISDNTVKLTTERMKARESRRQAEAARSAPDNGGDAA